jgi:hypothetical protein
MYNQIHILLTLGRNADYLRHAIKFGIDLPMAAPFLRYSPKFLKPFVKTEKTLISRLVSSFFVDIKRGRKFMHAAVVPLIEDRRQKMQEQGTEYKYPVTFIVIQN